MCLHESVGISDEARTLLCWDCGREFGHLARDEKETFVVYVTPDHPVLLVTDEGAPVGIPVRQENGRVVRDPDVYPCAKCAWDASCDEEDGGCHS